MIHYNDKNKTFHLQNDQISYVMKVDEYGVLSHCYFGSRLPRYSNYLSYPVIHRDFEVDFVDQNQKTKRDWSLGNILQEFPGYNHGDYRHPALILRQMDGSSVTDFRYQSYETIKGASSIEGLPHAYVDSSELAETLKVRLGDPTHSWFVDLYYTVFRNHPIITRWAVFRNESEEPVTIERMASFSLDLSPRPSEIIQLNGAWGRERMLEREAVHRGRKVYDSKRGTSSHQQTPFMALVSPNTTENQGAALGVQLVYSGSHELSVEQDPYQQIRLQAGIQSTGFRWKVEPDQEFATPQVVLAYSEDGLNGMSQAFHNFLKNHLIPARFRDKERPVLINNWEGTYFAFTEERLHAMVDSASDLGVELFVLDDGWFGKRDWDDSSLGDWFEYKTKLPHGLKGLADYVHSKGMQFGLWFEPEMISEDSELYRQHPDFALHTPGRAKSYGRNQYVLDMSRSDVQDHIYHQMVAVIEQTGLNYIKWDMNRHLSEVYSSAFPYDQQGEIVHRYMLGVYALMSRITSRYPEILFESCSGGGGRFDLGILAYMPQVWTSDNSDAVARLKIQYGTSLMVPTNAMGAHVSAVPNHQTGRKTPLASRAAVAFYGAFGYELDFTKLTKSEQFEIKDQVAFYKNHRTLFQQGTFHRLLSPFEADGNLTAWSLTNDSQTESMVMVFQVLRKASQPLQVLKLEGLKSECQYRVTQVLGEGAWGATLSKEEGGPEAEAMSLTEPACDDSNSNNSGVESGFQSFEASGAELMKAGFYLYPQVTKDFVGKLFYVEAIK